MQRVDGWTPEQDQRLATLWAQTAPHLTAAEIGKLMGKTKSAIAGRRLRLKLPERGSPIGRDGTVARAAEARRERDAVWTGRVIPPRPRLIAPRPAAPPPPARPASLSPHRTCQWISGPPRGAESAFCAAPSVPGCSWCATHRRKVFTPAIVRVTAA